MGILSELPPIRLTALTVKNIKPTAKTQRLFDGAGLYLEVSPKGGKWWRYKYRYAGKEKRISLCVCDFNRSTQHIG